MNWPLRLSFKVTRLKVERQEEMCMKQVISDVLSEFRCFKWTVKLIPLGTVALFYSIQTLRLNEFWEPSGLTQLPCFPPKTTSLQILSLKTVSRKAESFFCASSLLSAGKREREREGDGEEGSYWSGSVRSKLHIQGEHCLWLLSQRPDKSRDIPRAQWRGQTHSEKDRDLHHNLIYMHSSKLRHGDNRIICVEKNIHIPLNHWAV